MLVTPLPGVDRDNLLRALQYVRQEAFNTRGAGGTIVDRYNAYCRWAAEATRQLRSQITAGDLDKLILTRRYWALQSLSSSIVDPVGVLVHTELDERVNDLEVACRSLEEQIKSWLRPGVFVAADSSFYIHHPEKIQDLDFREILGVCEEPVHLIFPIVIIDELDRLKESKGNPHVRWRARHTLQVLDKILPNPTSVGYLSNKKFTPSSGGNAMRGEISVEIVLDPRGHQRLPNDDDDEIIDRTLAIQTMAGRALYFITNDTGQSTRARAVGLNTIKIPQSADEIEPAK